MDGPIAPGPAGIGQITITGVIPAIEGSYIFDIYAVLPSGVEDFSTRDNELSLQYIADETPPSQVTLVSPSN